MLRVALSINQPRQQLHHMGVRVLRMGLCSAKEPYSLEA